MQLFYTPRHARVGDVIPFYDEGVFKPFYLKNWNPYFGEDRSDGWHMLTTADNLHITDETPTGIRGGTGSVVKVDDVYHMFYCVFRRNPQRQYVCHAVSEDLKTWRTLEDETFGPDERLYIPTDWRDPHVFWNEEEQCWWMVLCALSQGATRRRGCIGLCKSKDLHHWTCCAPLYDPQSSMSGYECPDMFRMNGWWYLVFSQFTDRFQTIYRMSRSCHGPWIRPAVDSFDGRAFYAAKTGSDGARRYIYGWLPTRTQNHWLFNPNPMHEGYDNNTYDWGGSMVVHELAQHDDGTLWVKPIDALEGALTVPSTLKWVPMNGAWKLEDNGARVETPGAYASLLSMNQVPAQFRLHARFTFEPGTERVAICAQVDESFAKGYYFYFEPKRQRVEFKGPLRMHEQGGWTFPWDVELERPLKLAPGKPCDVTLYGDGTAMVLYVDGAVAMCVRVYDLRERKFGLVVSDGAARFEALELKTMGGMEQ